MKRIPYELLEALRDLDRRTPEYFRREAIHAEDDSGVIDDAIRVLRSLEGTGVGTDTLCALLRMPR